MDDIGIEDLGIFYFFIECLSCDTHIVDQNVITAFHHLMHHSIHTTGFVDVFHVYR